MPKRMYQQPLLWLLALGCSAAPGWSQTPTTRPTIRRAQPAPAKVAKVVVSPKRPWWRDAVFYQIFVRSFQDSNGDGIGDLKGIIQRLDDLKARPTTSAPTSRPSHKAPKALGVNALWLTPIFKSPSYHGYDTTDYRKINPPYGDLKVFKKLLKEAKKRGIRVVLDLMVNHTSRKHPWFLRAANATKSAHRSWYNWRTTDPGWRQPWGSGRVWHPLGKAFYYGIFWSGMPDLNLAHPPAKEAMLSIASHWLKQGVDGLRLDAARHLFADGPGAKQNDRPATHSFWRDFRRNAKAASPNALLVGEVWSSAAVIERYCDGTQFDLAFHFPLGKAIKLAVSAMEAAPLWKVLKHSLPTTCWATFLANHDQTRIITQLAGKEAMMRGAAFLLLTLPGTPFLYYGEEVGMPNGTKQKGDPAKRTPMAWDATPKGGFTTGKPWTPLAAHKRANVTVQRGNPRSLWRHYHKLIQLRHAHPALRHGKLTRLVVRGKGSAAVVAYIRSTPKQRLLVIRNLNDAAATKLSIVLPAGSKPKTLYKEGKAVLYKTTGSASWRPYLGAYSALVVAF